MSRKKQTEPRKGNEWVSPDVRLRAVREVLERDARMTDVAKLFDVSHGAVAKWVAKLRRGGVDALTTTKRKKTPAARGRDAELVRVERSVASDLALLVERDVEPKLLRGWSGVWWRHSSGGSEAGRRAWVRSAVALAAVCFTQLFGSAMQLSPHLHLLVAEGAWHDGVFTELSPPTPEEVDGGRARAYARPAVAGLRVEAPGVAR